MRFSQEEPKLGLGPGAGAQVASPQSLTLRSGPLVVYLDEWFLAMTERKNTLTFAALSDMLDNAQPQSCRQRSWRWSLDGSLSTSWWMTAV